MKTPRLPLLLLALSALCPMAGRSAETVQSDLVSPEKRRISVELSLHLAKPIDPDALPETLPEPFNPPGFDQPVPEEVRARAAVVTKSPTATTSATKPSTDRELLAHIAARIQPTGTFRVGGSTYLTFGQKRVRTGDILTVTYDGQDYELELIAADQSTFSLRLNKEELTRPLKPGKNP